MLRRLALPALLAAAALGSAAASAVAADAKPEAAKPPTPEVAKSETVKGDAPKVAYRTVKVDGLDIFYREAGPKDAPTILLLHGFPASSHMFRNLIPALAGEFHVVAPDYPGYGQSSAPPPDQFKYTFDHLAEVVEKFTVAAGLKSYALYVQDYGAPVGYRLAVRHPERVTGLVVQNGNAYDEGLPDAFWGPIKAMWAGRNAKTEAAPLEFMTLTGTKWQYLDGARNPEAISPDAWTMDQALLDRPGNKQIQLELLYDYRSNPPLYPSWHAYFQKYQPPTLIVWGKNDKIFPPAGAYPYQRDLKTVEFHLLDTGHFALEEESDRVATLMSAFLKKHPPAGK